MNQAQEVQSPALPAIIFATEPLTESERRLHEKALVRAVHYSRAEADLLETIMEIDHAKLYLKFDLGSTFGYCVKHLRLSEAVAYNFIAVARKAREIPQLKKVIESGNLGVSKARKIVSVLTTENQNEWIPKAVDLSQAQLEREVAESLPEEAVNERVRSVKKSRVKVEVTIGQATLEQLRQVQALISEKQGRAVSLEETLKIMTEDFLERHDPLRRAERAKRRGLSKREKPSNNSCDKSVDVKDGRQFIPAEVQHALNVRDQRRCQARFADGSQCMSRRYLHFHHILPVSMGGPNTVENLVTLCSACHRRWHRRSSP